MLSIANAFMTFAWYGHLQFKKWNILQEKGLLFIIVLSWLIALPEYAFQVPANKLGYKENGGPFDLFQLKILQEAITLIIFTLLSIFVFKSGKFNLNYFYSFICIMMAVYFAFRK